MSRRRAARPGRGAVVAVLAVLGVVLVVVGVGAGLVAGTERGTTTRDVLPEPTQTTSASPTPTPTPTPTPVPPPAETAPAALPGKGEPELLVVPHLGIRSDVLRIRVEDGVLTPPPDPMTVGWDIGTPKPGSALGSTVITGHTVHSGGGALNELDSLDVGDKVSVHTANGKVDYVISEITDYTKKEMVSEIPRLYDREVPGRLVLITCYDWNGEEYLSNIVAIAETVSDS